MTLGAANEIRAQKRAHYLPYLHLFRGAAILQIVAVHAGEAYLQAIVPAAGAESYPGMALLETLFHDCTIYFALISGLLYAHVFAARGIGRFYRSRLLSVVLPYVLLSAGLSLFAVYTGAHAPPPWPQILLGLARTIRLGGAWFHLWYMPVIIGLYAISPALYALVRAPRWRWLVGVLIAAPLVISRTGNYPGPSTFVYFTGAYVCGMVIGLNVDAALDRIARHWRALAATAAITTPLVYWLFLNGLDDVGRVSLQETVFYLQKTALAGLFVLGLRHWARTPGRWRDLALGAAATSAFAVYFLHAPLILPVLWALRAQVDPSAPAWLLVAGCVATYIGTLALTAVVIVVVRRLLGARSRYLIGA